MQNTVNEKQKNVIVVHGYLDTAFNSYTEYFWMTFIANPLQS